MLVKSTFFVLLSSVISATVAAPVAQAPDAISVSGLSAAATPSASADPANLDPAPVESAPGIDFGAASAPTGSSIAPLPSASIAPSFVSSFVPAPAPTTMVLKPVHIPAPPIKHEPPPVHITTSIHVPIHTPIKHIPPPVHITSTFHHVPVYTPIKHEPLPIHHTTTLKHILPPVHTPIHHIPPPVHTPIHIPPPVHHTTPLVHVPVHTPPAHVPVHIPVKHITFDKWEGHDSLKGFDDFYGVDNWDGYKFEQVFVKQEHELVCKVQQVHIIQQRLLVLQEMAKKIITETICEVETQTIVFEQWYAGLHGFGRDLRRYPGKHHQVGYDQEIVKHFPKIINQHDFSVNVDDWKFTGKDLGKHTVIVKGHNWDDKRSPALVWKAWGTARQAWHDIYGKWF